MTDATALFHKEFPDFDPATLPAIPAGFEDVSWHNDTCPSFLNEAAGLIIFVDFANPAIREHPDTKRFGLNIWETGNTNESVAYTDDWQDILDAIADRKPTPAKPVPVDPRRVLIGYHTNSFSPAAKRWYFVAIACEFDGALFFHKERAEAKENQTVSPVYTTKPDAIRAAKAFAKESGFPLVEGFFKGSYGKPLTKAKT